MSQTGTPAVTGRGAVTSVGLSAEATCVALRAGICRTREVETYRVRGPFGGLVPVIGARVPTEWFFGEPAGKTWPGHERFKVPLPPPPEAYVAPGTERLVELAAPAAVAAWMEAEAGGLGGRRGRFGLYLGLAQDEDPRPVEEAVARAVGTSFAQVVAVRRGRASGIAAVGVAASDLSEGKVDFALAGGVDSLIRGPVLERLDRAGLLKTEETPEGLIPGEGAAFLFLERANEAAARGAALVGVLLGWAEAEERTAQTGEPNRGEALTEVLRAVVQGPGASPSMPLVVCDLNGDRYRAAEWAMASIRVFGGIEGDLLLWHPADCIGDTGAAAGVVCLVFALYAVGRGLGGATRAVVWGASDGALRAAAALSAGR